MGACMSAPSSTNPLVEQFVSSEGHKNDKNRRVTELFMRHSAFDWEREPKGHTTDADKSIVIGSGDEPEPYLLIRHIDAEQKYKQRTHDPMPAVWGLACTVEEFATLTKKVPKGKMTLIHREEQESDQVIQESHWLVEGGSVVGVRTVIKCSQDPIPVVKACRFKVVGKRFVLEGEETISNGDPVGNFNAPPLPVPPADVLPAVEHAATKAPVSTTYKAGGDSALELRVNDGGEYSLQRLYHAVHNFEAQGRLKQRLSTAVITVTNPSKAQIAVPEFWMEWRGVGGGAGEWTKCEACSVGYNYGHNTSFTDQASFEVDKHSSVELVFGGDISMDLGEHKPYTGNHRFRNHAAFPDPIAYRITLRDEKKRTKHMVFEYSNTPLEHPWTTAEGAMAAMADKNLDGFGEGHQIDMWACVENPLSLDKCMLVVTTARTNPHEWYVRATNDRRDVYAGYSRHRPESLRRLAYKAAREGKTEVEVDSAGSEVVLTGLVDVPTRTMYALRGRVLIEHAGRVLADVTRYMPLDYATVTEED